MFCSIAPLPRQVSSIAVAIDGLGRAVVYSATWQPALWIPVLGFTLAVVVVFVLYQREKRSTSRSRWRALLACRLTLIGLVVFMLFGWVRHEYRTVLPDLVILIDNSASMGHEDHLSDKVLSERLRRQLKQLNLARLSRINLAKLLLLERDQTLLDRLSSKYNLYVYRLLPAAASDAPLTEGDALRSLEANGESSQIGKRVRELLEQQRGRSTVAIVLFSDGITTEGERLSEVATDAQRQGIPLYTVELGSAAPRRDLRLSDLVADRSVFPQDLVTVSVNLHAVGFSPEKVVLRMRQDGNSTALAETTVTLEAAESRRVELSFRPSVEGVFHYVIEVDPADGEQDLSNNRLYYTVVVRDTSIRVLFVQDYPSFEWRYLTTLLRRTVQGSSFNDQAIELTTVLHQADRRLVEDNARTTVTQVSDEIDLENVDVVIFGDVDPSRMSQAIMERVAQFVIQQGGGLVFLAGPRFTPLAYRETPLTPLIPIDLATAELPPDSAAIDEEQAFHARLSELGRNTSFLQLADDVQANREVWDGFPKLRWMLQSSRVLPAARVLAIHPSRRTATGDSPPLICMQFVGRGKVVFHATDETYRWSRHPLGDQYYARYWLQLIRYLVPERRVDGDTPVQLRSIRNEYSLGEAVRFTVRFGDEQLAPADDEGVVVVVQRHGGRRHRLHLSRFGNRREVFWVKSPHFRQGNTVSGWQNRPSKSDRPPIGLGCARRQVNKCDWPWTRKNLTRRRSVRGDGTMWG